MRWIKYQIVQCTIGQENILLDKKVGYNDTNLAIAKKEAYQGQYEVFEDDTPEPSKGIAPTSLSDAVDSTSGVDDGIAATPAAVREAYELAKTKANAADIAKTAMGAMSNSAVSYVRIYDFGSWGTGAWYAKGFSMLVTSRAGETIWVSVAADDSNTRAQAIRLMNCYSKIIALYYCAEDNSLYVKVNAWCNNVNAHILSNVYGDYVAQIQEVSSIPGTAVEITITEFGPGYDTTNIGVSSCALSMTGKNDRPTYNGANMAMQDDIPSTTEALNFTYDDGSTRTVEVYVK